MVIDVACSCGSGQPYLECCDPFHRELSAAPTAEALMRSRYSAFVVRHAAYLLRTWHPRTRPRTLELDENERWTRLDVLATEAGGLFDSEGIVEFRAHYKVGGRPGVLHERSRFLRHEANWVYLGSQA